MLHVIASSSTPGRALKHSFKAAMKAASLLHVQTVSGQGHILHGRNTSHTSGQNDAMDPAGAASNTEPSHFSKGKSGTSSSGNQHCKLCHTQGLWRSMAGSLGNSVQWRNISKVLVQIDGLQQEPLIQSQAVNPLKYFHSLSRKNPQKTVSFHHKYGSKNQFSELPFSHLVNNAQMHKKLQSLLNGTCCSLPRAYSGQQR